MFALTTQQALPKSAILTCSLSALAGSRGSTNKLADASVRRGRRITKCKYIIFCEIIIMKQTTNPSVYGLHNDSDDYVYCEAGIFSEM